VQANGGDRKSEKYGATSRASVKRKRVTEENEDDPVPRDVARNLRSRMYMYLCTYVLMY
jgi:hypothetical protein